MALALGAFLTGCFAGAWFVLIGDYVSDHPTYGGKSSILKEAEESKRHGD